MTDPAPVPQVPCDKFAKGVEGDDRNGHRGKLTLLGRVQKRNIRPLESRAPLDTIGIFSSPTLEGRRLERDGLPSRFRYEFGVAGRN
jgi:hypothetical protein